MTFFRFSTDFLFSTIRLTGKTPWATGTSTTGTAEPRGKPPEQGHFCRGAWGALKVLSEALLEVMFTVWKEEAVV